MKLKIKFSLIILSIFFSNNIISKEINKSCDELLRENKYEEALKTKKAEYKAAFCHGQAYLKLHHYDEAFNDFKLANKLAKNDTDHFMADLLEGVSLKKANKLEWLKKVALATYNTKYYRLLDLSKSEG